MKAPKRWIETQSGSTALERALLSPGLNIEVPAGVEDRIWASLAAAAPVVATGAAAAHAAHAAHAAKVPLAAIAKAFAIGAASGALLTGGLSALEPARITTSVAPAPLATASHAPAKRAAGSVRVPSGAASVAIDSVPPPAVPLPAMPALDRTPEPERRPQRSAAASEPASDAPAPPVPGSRLKEEAATLRRARAALRRGDLPGASAALEVARSRFGNGALGEEREALTIELLARSGQRAAANARAAAFLRSYPNSPHAAHVRSFAY